MAAATPGSRISARSRRGCDRHSPRRRVKSRPTRPAARRSTARRCPLQVRTRRGKTSVVLMGDSHAMMITDPIARGAGEGWRLMTMIKGLHPRPGHPEPRPALADDGASCRRWRRKVIAGSRPTRPTTSSWPTRSLPHRHPQGHADQGCRASRRLARRHEAHDRGRCHRPPRCWCSETSRATTGTPSAACETTPRTCPVASPARAALEAQGGEGTARGRGCQGCDIPQPVPQDLSYDPCPVIQGDVLMWRDQVTTAPRSPVSSHRRSARWWGTPAPRRRRASGDDAALDARQRKGRPAPGARARPGGIGPCHGRRRPPARPRTGTA